VVREIKKKGEGMPLRIKTLLLYFCVVAMEVGTMIGVTQMKMFNENQMIRFALQYVISNFDHIEEFMEECEEQDHLPPESEWQRLYEKMEKTNDKV
jgi:sensor histidine kinase regulating citrate/malate metabolism